jgi:hypothetical protein
MKVLGTLVSNIKQNWFIEFYCNCQAHFDNGKYIFLITDSGAFIIKRSLTPLTN